MKFNDTSNNSGICQDVWYLTGTDSTSLTTSTIARIANKVLRELALDAWRFSNSWKFDDSNQTTHPIAEQTLTNGQGDYSLPSTAFDIQKAEIQDAAGNWYPLKPISLDELKNIAVDEFYKTNGRPIYYYLEGFSLKLKPAPDTSQATKVRIYLSRDIVEFVSTDTTKEPGIPSVLHPLIPYLVALEYASTNGLNDKIAYLNKKSQEWWDRFVSYFENRGELKVKFKPKYYNFE
jgi:hypothetical protein